MPSLHLLDAYLCDTWILFSHTNVHTRDLGLMIEGAMSVLESTSVFSGKATVWSYLKSGSISL